MGFAPFLMMAAGTGIQALSSYRQGQYASMQAKAQAGISRYNAEIAETNAEAVRQKSIFDQLRAVRAGRRQIGKLRAIQGAGGAVLSEGAPADILAEQSFENALDVALIGYNSQVEQSRLKSAAAGYRAQAGYQEASAKNYMTAGKIGAGTSLLTGLGGMSAMGAYPKSLDFLNMKT